MRIHLKDIIDLDYLLSLDDQRDSGEEKEQTLARDREIFKQLDSTGLDQNKMDDTRLLFAWLEYRRLVFFHEAGEQKGILLPGRVFSFLYRWIVYFLMITGFLSGISLAYSFLAYHGTRPVNVTIFFAVFIFSQVLLFALTLVFLVRRFLREQTGSMGHRHSIVHTLLAGVFSRGLPGLLKKIRGPMGEKKMDTIEYTASLVQMNNREYRGVFFWPFFVLSSFFAVSFSLGALGGTLFRVAVSDMAFGWQSTLMTASTSIRDGLSLISLPWSWFVPVAHPSLEQIEGTRILLKEGISTLATKDLVSWWPFLCLGILFYGVLPRFLLIVASFMAQKKALGQFNFETPRFKRLVVRMQSPVMDIRFEEQPISRAGRKIILPDPSEPDLFGLDSTLPDPFGPSGSEGEAEMDFTGAPFKGAMALVLASGSVYGEDDLGAVANLISRQFFFDVRSSVPVSFDYAKDRESLATLAASFPDPIIILQEVWQPPIRGLLHYFVQLKSQIFTDRPMWILLTQTPGEENRVVEGEDVNFKVWKKAVRQLGNPEIILERVYK